MNIQQLRYFAGVCQYGNFAKAAQKLFISPQGLSMSVLRLEEEYSCKLFNRSSNGVRMTEAGAFLYEKCKKILAELDDCETYFSNLQTPYNKVLVGCVYGGLSEFLAREVLSFEAQHPNSKLLVTEYPSILCDQAVERGDVEFALNLAPFDPQKFESFSVFSKRLCIAVRKDHPLAGEKTIKTDSLHHLPMVTVNDSFKSRRLFLDICKSVRIEPDIKMQVGDISGVHRLVNTTPSLAGLTTESVSAALPLPDVVSIPLEDENFIWDVHLVKKRGVVLLPVAHAFEMYMRRHASSGSGS